MRQLLFAIPVIAVEFTSLGVSTDNVAPCHVNGLLPDSACTPGDVETTDLGVICHQATRNRRHVDEATHEYAFAEYGLSPHQPRGDYEVDHLIPLEIGGSNNIKNLWPEAAPGFHRKDEVENKLHELVCSGRMTIDAAQKAIATDWTRALP